MPRMRRVSGLLAGTVASLALTTAAIAAPFSISYTGTIAGGSTLPGVVSGQPYTVTLVVDNGGATAATQAWGSANLQCAIFRMNTAGNVTYAQNLVTSAASMAVAGSITTDGAGALTTNFTSVESNAPLASTYSAAGIALVDPVNWFLNAINDVFYDTAFARSFGDAAGGTQMGIGSWTNPAPAAGACAAAFGPPAQIPTLSQWGMILLAGLLALGAFPLLRGRRR